MKRVAPCPFLAFALLACLSLGGLSPAQGQFLLWQYEDIATDLRQSGAHPDLHLAPNGVWHMSFWSTETERLYYARRNGPAQPWVIVPVPDQGLFGLRSSITTDAQGRVHIAYISEQSDQAFLRYARLENGAWTFESPYPESHIGKYGPDETIPGNIQHSLDIFLRSDGQPSILFFNGRFDNVASCAGIDLTYLNYRLDLNLVNRQSSGAWGFFNFPNLPYSGPGTCLNNGDRFGEFCQMLQSGGNYYAIGNALHNHDLMLWETQSPQLNAWQTWIADSVRRVFPTNTLAFFREGYTHISGSLMGDSVLHLAYGLSNFYGQEPEIANRQTFFYSRVRLDSLGDPLYRPYYFRFQPSNTPRQFFSIAHISRDSVAIAYQSRSSGRCIVALTPDGGRTWGQDSIAQILTASRMHLLRSADSLHLFIHDELRDELLEFSSDRATSTWKQKRATRTERRGEALASRVLRNGSDDEVYIAYTESSEDRLYVARRVQGQWSSSLVAQGGGLASPAIFTLSSGRNGLAYVSREDETLRLAAEQANGSWALSTPDSSRQPRDLQALRVGDTLHFVFFDAANRDLLHLRGREGGPWLAQVIDSSSQIVGTQPSLQADAAGRLHVAYLDPFSGKLRYALRQGGSWIREDLSNPGEYTPSFPSLSLSSGGQPLVGFRDGAQNRIFIAEKQGSTWSIAPVATEVSTQIGAPLRLLVDEKDRPWILYNFSATSQGLRLSRRADGGEWLAVSVNANGAEIAGQFGFHLAGNDFYIPGKKNQTGNRGLGLLSAPEGVKTLAEASLMLAAPSLSPNPSDGALRISFGNPATQPVSVRLYNLEGQLLHVVMEERSLPAGETEIRWQAEGLAPGIYVCQIQTPAHLYALKWVLVR
jgi:hypothetical protein